MMSAFPASSVPHAVDIVGIGAANVDVLASVDDDFLAAHGLDKGITTNVGLDRLLAVEEALTGTTIVAGGAAANTVAGFVALGGRAAFIGKVGDDALGIVFRYASRNEGVAFDTPDLRGVPTSRCLVLSTPDGERSFVLSLDAAGKRLDAPDIDAEEELIARAGIVYLQLNLTVTGPGGRAMARAAQLARAHGRRLVVNLFDAGVMAARRDAVNAILADGVDLVIANHAEIMALLGVGSLDEAVARCRRQDWPTVVTCGKDGALVAGRGEVWHIAPCPPARFVDSCGAGDQFAAGFLWGCTHGLPPAECGRLAARTAAAIIAEPGARPTPGAFQAIAREVLAGHAPSAALVP